MRVLVGMVIWMLGTSGCRDGGAEALPNPARAAVPSASCAGSSAFPARAAPGGGLWAGSDSATGTQVAAFIGAVRPTPGLPWIARRVETVEARPGLPPLREHSDSAVAALELLPPFAGGSDRPGRVEARPALTYTVSAQTLLAAYESCAVTTEASLLRYLRRDTGGTVRTDLLLRRESAP